MEPLELTVACGRYDRVAALAEERVQAEGLRLRWLDLPPEETFWRMLRYQEFDASELSLSSYLIARDRGSPDLRAIPVFPLRRFRHGGVYVRADAGIERPEDLAGRRVGVPEYQMTAALWVRGLLEHEYGVASRSIRWVTGGQVVAGREERLPFQPLGGLEITAVRDATLEDLLEAGEIEALISPRPPRAYLDGPSVLRLFPDTRAAEQAYFRRTGIFPIMHVVAVRGPVLDRHPWVAQNLYKAFEAARQAWYRSFRHEAARLYGLPWVEAAIAETTGVMGEDFWTYGVDANRATLEAALTYSQEQGLIGRRPAVDEIFVPSTLQPAAE